MISNIVLAGVLALMLTLPGWALLALSHLGRDWSALRRWCVAIGLSLSMYPALFYWARWVAPSFTLGPLKLWALLIMCAVLAVWEWRAAPAAAWQFDRSQVFALVILGATLFTRFWIIRDHPYPAWSDSLHHVLLTQLTAATGQLPPSLEPYMPIPLDMYHLGLYALSGTAQMLSGAPAHTALLWMAQVLNGLCGMGLYLALEWHGGGTPAARLSGAVGAAVVGLFSFQPAWYVNWGRFTQVASQTVLPVAWALLWLTLAQWRLLSGTRRERWGLIGLTALTTSAVFLLHYRSAGIYLPLIGLTIAWELFKAWPQRRWAQVVWATLLIGLVTLVLISPSLWAALKIYYWRLTAGMQATSANAQEINQTLTEYYATSLESVFVIGLRPWLIGLTAVGIGFGLWRRNSLIGLVTIWGVALWFIANAYLLGARLIAFTNAGAVIIMLYLPAGFILGGVAREVARWPWLAERRVAYSVLAVFLCGAGWTGWARAVEVEPMRYFVRPADVTAMEWITTHVPPDARFAINITFWSPLFPHGTDAGYWIPYFTGRKTTTGSMLFSLGDAAYFDQIVAWGKSVARLPDPAALVELRQSGVTHIYIGQAGNFGGPGLQLSVLRELPGMRVLYEQEGVAILALDPAP